MTEADPHVQNVFDTLDDLKNFRNSQIDARTSEICLSGFTWNGEQFSTSDTAQRNWLALKVFSDIIVYPKRISKLDGGHYDLADEAELLNFCGYCLGVLESRHATGVALRDQINDAANEAAVDAVVDTR